MSTFIPPTPAATKSAEQHEEPPEQDSFNHLLYKVLRLTSEQVQDLNDGMKHRGIPNVHEIIAQNFRKPHALEDDLQFIRENKPCYIQSNVMVSLSLMITYIKHLWYSAKTKYFGPFYYIQIDPQDYDEWRITPPEEEVHFQTPSKHGSPATPRSMATSEASESYITLTNFKKGIKRDASAYPIFKNERYYNTFIRHFKATAKAQGLNSLMDPNFTPGSDEYEQQLFQEQQDFLYSVLISSLKSDFSEALVMDHERDAPLILELLHEHHTGNSHYWFGCDWWLCEVGYLSLRAGQLSLTCAVVYLWNTGNIRVTRPRIKTGIQYTPAAQVGKREVSWVGWRGWWVEIDKPHVTVVNWGMQFCKIIHFVEFIWGPSD